MIKIEYIKHILESPLAQALDRVANIPAFDMKTAYALAKIHEKVEQAKRDTLKAYHKVVPTFADKDAEDKPIRSRTGEYAVKVDQADACWAAIEKEVGGKSFSILQKKLKPSVFASIKLSPLEMQGLEPLIEGLEEVEDKQLELGL